jgi:SPRY domain
MDRMMITFDIGGTIYCISNPNHNQNNANNNNNDNNTPIFLDGNGYRFSYVLQAIQTNHFTCDLPSDISRVTLFHDLEYYGFGYPPRYLPEDVMCVDHVQHHIITWDVCRAAAGLELIDKNQVVQCRQSAAPLGRIVFGNQALTSGIHYWSIEIKRTEPNTPIMIGVANNISVHELVAFGSKTTTPYRHNAGRRDIYKESCADGICYLGINGNICSKNRNDLFGLSFTAGDVIGTLLNVTCGTVTFYKNGKRVGTAGRHCSGQYPYVCLFHEQQEIRSYNTVNSLSRPPRNDRKETKNKTNDTRYDHIIECWWNHISSE